MKDGRPIRVEAGAPITEDNGEHGKVTIHPWSKPISWEDGLIKMTGFLKAAIRDGYLDVMQDMVLCPYNVKFGVIELNTAIADYLGRQRGAKVFEVIAGFNTHYYAVGDKVLAQKQEAIIVGIDRNSRYAGKRPINADLYDIDRHGGARKKKAAESLSVGAEFELTQDMDIDAFLEGMVTTVEDRVTAASHKIYLMPKDIFLDAQESWVPQDGQTTEDFYKHCREHTSWIAEGASEVNEMLFGYCITVHKSQGSEWRRVFLITHQSHAQMCSRELMYTAMTRARKELYMVVEPDRGMKAGTLVSSAGKPRLKGNTLAEKLISLKERFEKEAREAQGKAKQQQLEEVEE